MLRSTPRNALILAVAMAWAHMPASAQILLNGYTTAQFGQISPGMPTTPFTINYLDSQGRPRADAAIEIGEPSGAAGNERYWRFSNQTRRHGNLYELNSASFSGVQPGSPFLLSNLQYFNAEIFAPGSSIFTIPTISTIHFDNLPGVASADFGFDFRLTFTDNQGLPQGVPDTIEFVNRSSARTVLIDSRTYSLRLLGFSSDGGQTLSGRFTLPEYQSVGSGLYATFEEVLGPNLYLRTPDKINFQTRVGRAIEQTVQVQNNGASGSVLTGTIGGLPAGGAFATAGGSSPVSFVLAPGQSASRAITYAPASRTRGTPSVQSIRVNTNAGNADVSLIGEAFGPVYFSFPLPDATLAMGRVMAGAGSTFLNISNITDDGEREDFTYMTLRSLDFAGADASAFGVSGVGSGTRLGFNVTRAAQVRLIGGGRGAKSAALTIDTDVNADLGADGQDYRYTVTATALDKRRVSASEVNFGRVMLGVAQGPRVTEIRGDVTPDNFYTNPGIRTQGNFSGPVTVGPDTGLPAPNPSTPWRTVDSSDGRLVSARDVTASFAQPGTQSGTVPLFTRPEGLPGEGTYDLAVPWRATVVENRSLTGSTVSFGAVFQGSQRTLSATVSTTGTDDRFTRVRLNPGTYLAGPASATVSTSTVFTGPSSTATVAVTAAFAQPGPTSGSIPLSTANGAINGEGLAGEVVRSTSIPWNANVLTRGTPSFSPGKSTTPSLLLDFGSFPAGSGLQNLNFDLFNIATSAFTAAIEFDGVTLATGDTGRFVTNLPASFDGLAAGSSRPFVASFDTSNAGTFTATYQLSFFDQRTVFGAATRPSLTLTLSGTVVSASAPTRTNIVIDNPSFEFVRDNAGSVRNIVLDPGQYTWGMSSTLINLGTSDDPILVPRFVPGWVTSFEFDELAGVVRPDPLAGTYAPDEHFQGYHTSYLRDDSFAQTVEGTFLPDETYELSFLVGRRAGVEQFISPTHQVFLGTTLVSPLAVDQPIPDEGEIVRWTARYRLDSGNPLLGRPLTLVFAGNPGGVVDVDDIKLVIPGFGPPTATVSRWRWSTGGMWSEVGKWSFGVPDFVGSEVQFDDAIIAPSTVYVDEPVTVGVMRFNHSVPYTLAPWNDQKLTLEQPPDAGPAQINVLAGRHSILSGISLESDLTVSIAAGHSLTLGGTLESEAVRTITRNGAGTLTVSESPVLPIGSQLVVLNGTSRFLANLGRPDAPTTRLAVDGAVTQVDLEASQDVLDLEVGPSALVRFGASFGVIEATSVFTSGGRLDIGNGTLLIDYSGDSPLDSVRQQILSAFNNGLWDGPGITSRFAGDLLSVAAVEATDVFAVFPSVYADRVIDASTLIVRLAPAGDTDLDGLVGFVDLLTVARHFEQTGTWSEGDSTYDGKVDFADLMAMAQSMGRMSSRVEPNASFDPAFSAQFALARSMVPEPASLGVVVGLALVALRRVR